MFVASLPYFAILSATISAVAALISAKTGWR